MRGHFGGLCGLAHFVCVQTWLRSVLFLFGSLLDTERLCLLFNVFRNIYVQQGTKRPTVVPGQLLKVRGCFLFLHHSLSIMVKI